jgi:arylsulfatase A-like enzyme
MLGSNGAAIRHGDWWFFPKQGSGGASTGTGKWWVRLPDFERKPGDYHADGTLRADAPPGQLYNLRADPGQTTNLYNDHPEIVRDMLKRYEESQTATRRPRAQ